MTSLNALEKTELLNPDGQPVALGSLWQEQSIILVFLRHFG